MDTQTKLYSASARVNVGDWKNVPASFYIPLGEKRPFDPKAFVNPDKCLVRGNGPIARADAEPEDWERSFRMSADAVAELFTKEESEQLADYMAKHDIAVKVQEANLPAENWLPLGAIGARGNGSEGYIFLWDFPGYTLPFKVEFFYNVNDDPEVIWPETKGELPATETPPAGEVCPVCNKPIAQGDLRARDNLINLVELAENSKHEKGFTLSTWFENSYNGHKAKHQPYKTKREAVKAELLHDLEGNEPTAIVEILGDEPENGRGQLIQVATSYTLIPGCYWPAVAVQIHTHATRENILRVLWETIDLVKGENDILGLEEFEYRLNQAKEKNKELVSVETDNDIPF